MKNNFNIIYAKQVNIGANINFSSKSGITIGASRHNVGISVSEDNAWLGIGDNMIQINCADGYAGVIINRTAFYGVVEGEFLNSTEGEKNAQ